MFVAIYLIWYGSSGLYEPDGVSTNFGDIGVGVAVEDSRKPGDYPFPDAEVIGVGVYAAPELGTVATSTVYTLFFPRQFANRSFALMLEDSATLSGVRSSVATRQTPIRSCKETGGEGEYSYSKEHKCQVIYGIVPDHQSDANKPSPTCHPYEHEIFDFDSNAAIIVRVSGSADLVERQDWAHSVVQLPTTVGVGPPSVIETWNGMDLRERFGTALQTGCKVAATPSLATVGGVSDAPTSSDQFFLRWEDSDAVQSVSFVATSRSRDRFVNLWIALGGLLGGIALSRLGATLSKRH
ncbi:hypothetical protein ACIO3S_17855 [Nocardioides sp. NPDC087217]|uniref:hypothetical protein n=1 Tax=Nocardioides sp. NPDC087217 TaxID=3364335 RepID=UPI003808A306